VGLAPRSSARGRQSGAVRGGRKHTAGGLDSAADFARHDVYGRPDLLDGVALRVDCGRSDPFYSATRDFVGRLPQRPAGRFGPGEHTAAYWRRVAPAELAFLGRHLGTH
jgi:hypothetical protein